LIVCIGLYRRWAESRAEHLASAGNSTRCLLIFSGDYFALRSVASPTFHVANNSETLRVTVWTSFARQGFAHQLNRNAQ
jgi:hypothetical protein